MPYCIMARRSRPTPIVNDYPRRRLDRIASQLDDATVGAYISISSRFGQSSQFVVVVSNGTV